MEEVEGEEQVEKEEEGDMEEVEGEEQVVEEDEAKDGVEGADLVIWRDDFPHRPLIVLYQQW